MNTLAVTSSTQHAAEPQNSTPAPAAPAPPRTPILTERWPALGRALEHHSQGLAEAFTRTAYDAVISGLIRHSDRKRLARQAAALGLRPFDAQLLIACAIRQWSLDHRYDAAPSPRAPALSVEFRSWKCTCMRVALVVGTAAILDGIVLWKWLAL